MERYHPLLETEIVKIYVKRDKSLIVSPKEFTFQTPKKIIKRKRMNIENELFAINRLQKEGKPVSAKKKELEEKLWNKERPRWKVIDSDEGILFARKDYSEDRVKHMDILDDLENKSRSIIIYETGNEENPVMVRTNAPRKHRK